MSPRRSFWRIRWASPKLVAMLAGRNPPAGHVVSTLAMRAQDPREGFVCCAAHKQSEAGVKRCDCSDRRVTSHARVGGWGNEGSGEIERGHARARLLAHPLILSRAASHIGALSLILVVAAVMRAIPLFANYPLHHDEALYGFWARLIVSGRDPLLLTAWVDKPPLVIYALAGSLRLLGISELALRLPGVIVSLATLVCTYGLASRVYERRTALIGCRAPCRIALRNPVRSDGLHRSVAHPVAGGCGVGCAGGTLVPCRHRIGSGGGLEATRGAGRAAHRSASADGGSESPANGRNLGVCPSSFVLRPPSLVGSSSPCWASL